MKKRVFVLGAGFSCKAGLPLQSEILAAIGRQRTLPPALTRVLRTLYPRGANPTLEDVFTLFDQSVTKMQWCRGLSWRQIEQGRRALIYQIFLLMQKALARIPSKEAAFYRRLSAYLIHYRIAKNKKGDPLTVISLNWDALLENSVSWCAEQANCGSKVEIDYCCCVDRLNSLRPGRRPSQHESGQYGIRVVKIHGSVNWLLCPNCGRLYTTLGMRDESYIILPQCPSCARSSASSALNMRNKVPTLEPLIVTPTYLKAFDNPHLQMTWYSAHIELSEAAEIVFIGYSFPEADYHFRALLRRAVGPRCRVSVVMTPSDEPDGNTPEHLRRHCPRERYESFFGRSRVNWYSCGVEGYFTKLFEEVSLDEYLEQIKALSGSPKPLP